MTSEGLNNILIFNCYDEETLNKIDPYIGKISCVCINNAIDPESSYNLDIDDMAIKYLVDHDLPGEVVSVRDPVRYVQTSNLEIYSANFRIILLDGFTGEEKIITSPINPSNSLSIRMPENSIQQPLHDEDENFFSLGESYNSRNMTEEAIQCYNKVLYNDKYTTQQKYIACLNLGKLSSQTTDRIKFFLLGISFDHQRAECYYELVILENCRGNSQKAAFYGLQCPIDSIDTPRTYDLSKLQINTVVHTYLLDLNLGVACYYANRKRDGYFATLRAMKGAIDEHQKNMAMNNLKYYDEIKKEMTYKPEVLVIDDFYPDYSSMVKDLFHTNNITREYSNIELLVNDHSHFIVKPKGDFSTVRTAFRKIFNTELGDLCSSSGLINLKGGYMSNWVNYNHNHAWNIVIFLQPQSQGSSLELLQHVDTKIRQATPETIPVIEKDVYNTSAWKVTEKVEERSNRCVVYKGNRPFQFTKYYNGPTLDTYMMYQSFCFDI